MLAPIEQVSPVAGFVAVATMWLTDLGGSRLEMLNDPSAMVRVVRLTNATPFLVSLTFQVTPAMWRAMSTPKSTLIWPVSSRCSCRLLMLVLLQRWLMFTAAGVAAWTGRVAPRAPMPSAAGRAMRASRRIFTGGSLVSADVCRVTDVGAP